MLSDGCNNHFIIFFAGLIAGFQPRCSAFSSSDARQGKPAPISPKNCLHRATLLLRMANVPIWACITEPSKNMSVVLKKGISVQNAPGMAVAITYLLASFSVPLVHTCPLWRLSPCAQAGSPRRHCCGQSHSAIQTDIVSDQDNHNAHHPHFSKECPACLYSITSKTFYPVPAGFLAIPNAPTRFDSNISSRAVRKAEWTSSIFLRAPPPSAS